MKILIAIATMITMSQADVRCDMARTELHTMGVKVEAAIAGRFDREAYYYQRKQIASIVKVRRLCKLHPLEKELLDKLDVLSKESLVLMEKLQ